MFDTDLEITRKSLANTSILFHEVETESAYQIILEPNKIPIIFAFDKEDGSMMGLRIKDFYYKTVDWLDWIQND